MTNRYFTIRPIPIFDWYTDTRSSHPPADNAILTGLNRALALLEDIRRTQINGHASSSSSAQLRDPPASSHVQDHVDPLGSTSATAHSAFTDGGFGRLEVSATAAKTSSCESILQWPVVKNYTACDAIVSFPLQSIGRKPADFKVADCRQDPATWTSRRAAAINENEVYPLCRKFLALIHIKNPVLNVSQLMQSAREVAESGPGWDGQTCLVLLACALASISAPFSRQQANQTSPQVMSPDGVLHNDLDALVVGEAYATAARRRLGLIETTLLSAQCLYFDGLYEKFMMRPFSAWKSFQRACVELQSYLYARGLNSTASNDPDRVRHVEQRLYWSCVRGECELRAELQLPTSGLLDFKYPDLFPYLSLPTSSEHNIDTPAIQGELVYDTPSTVSTSLDLDEERSWLHYLAEISLRKLMNRILEALYANGEHSWQTHIHQILSQYAILKEDLLGWRTHLPETLRFSDEEVPDNELALFLKTRYLGCWEWIHRPFLYYMLHQPSAATPVAAVAAAHTFAPLARECLQTCSELILLTARHHRHGGVWALVRKSFGAAVMILAASKVDTLEVQVGDIPMLADTTMQMIRQWNNDSTDLTWMEQTFAQVLADFDVPMLAT